MTINTGIIHHTAKKARLEIKERSDKLMNYFLIGYFFVGILLAAFYGTWLVAFGIGGIVLLAYYSVKMMLPDSSLYQYVLSAGFGIFMAQFIYQMHGLFEMHFFAFIGSALLITYQKWKLQIPTLVVVLVHHLIFGYLHNIGYDKLYFTQLDYFTVQALVIHIMLTAAIFFICGLWAYQLKKYNEIYLGQTLQMADLLKDAQLSIERKQNAEILTRLNEDLQNQARELAHSNSELEQFAYVASHDLQEPLRMISSFLTLLEKKYADIIDDKGRQYIHFAVDGSKRMHRIIMDLLQFSRVGRMEDKFEEVDLQHIVNEICGLYRKQMQEKKATIIFNNLPVIQSFKAPITQVFHNLIGNGLKYQRPDTFPVVNISAKEEPLHWLFSIRDNGIGINAEYFEKIFEIFQRLHGSADYEGTGLGLAVTKKIIENLGGKIWVESEEGKGSTFYFTILKK